MRTIKFRGKRLGNGVWIYGDLIHIDKSDIGIVTDYDHWQGCRVDPETIGQFTGLHDKNGKEIYEGDRLKMKYIDGTIEYYNVVFRKTGFHVDMEQYGHALLWTIDRNRIEVVGNIHD